AFVWLAEADHNGELIHITRALSDFFRISLSQGKDWIPLSEEVKHLTGYLTIQKIRYRDILDYDIDIPESLYTRQILKLLLQPLVENAIYHGIKHRRGRGRVVVTGREMAGYLTLSRRRPAMACSTSISASSSTTTKPRAFKSKQTEGAR
ncbi:MAG: histidine kinase, partial [Clostridia bacterium]